MENLLELIPLHTEAIAEKIREFIKFEVEGFGVLSNLSIELGFGINFPLSELISQSLASFVKGGSFSFTEGGECFSLLVKDF
jgi:hypothetical protein